MDSLHILFNDRFVGYRSFKTQQFLCHFTCYCCCSPWDSFILCSCVINVYWNYFCCYVCFFLWKSVGIKRFLQILSIPQLSCLMFGQVWSWYVKSRDRETRRETFWLFRLSRLRRESRPKLFKL